MQNVAVMLARACEYSKAIEAAANIQSPFYQALALADIGVLQARDGWTLDKHALTILDSLSACTSLGSIVGVAVGADYATGQRIQFNLICPDRMARECSTFQDCSSAGRGTL